MSSRYNSILTEIYNEALPLKQTGTVANYIPELAKIDPDKFGIHLRTLDGDDFFIGDSDEKFSIQSISKVFALALAVSLIGEKVFKRVGVEPSGSSFNSLVQLEYEKGIPRNPLINAGAMVVCDILIDKLKHPKKEILNFVRKLSGNQSVSFNEHVAASEKEFGFRNAALANLVKSFGNIHHTVDEVLDIYFHICSLEMSCRDLATAFLLFANHGKLPNTHEEILTKSQTKRLSAVMQTCGFYDEAGEFSFTVGLPGKSGVGGGIVALHPHKYAVATWSPRLNAKGNSVMGMKALELLTTKLGSSIF
ncbi:MAG: glutaminase [Ignavibacteriales bacterium]|nr:glutaminase [Ignavibacteriales bacterium]